MAAHTAATSVVTGVSEVTSDPRWAHPSRVCRQRHAAWRPTADGVTLRLSPERDVPKGRAIDLQMSSTTFLTSNELNRHFDANQLPFYFDQRLLTLQPQWVAIIPETDVRIV